MRIELKNENRQPVGTLALVDGEVVLEGTDATMADFLRGLTVVVPDGDPVTMADGADYLRALPATLRGPYLSATLFD